MDNRIHAHTASRIVGPETIQADVPQQLDPMSSDNNRTSPVRSRFVLDFVSDLLFVGDAGTTELALSSTGMGCVYRKPRPVCVRKT
jgi:hypothetical protein